MIAQSKHIEAATAALEIHSKLAGIDTDDGHGDENSVSIAMYHLLHSLIDVAEEEDFSFQELVQQVLCDRD